MKTIIGAIHEGDRQSRSHLSPRDGAPAHPALLIVECQGTRAAVKAPIGYLHVQERSLGSRL